MLKLLTYILSILLTSLLWVACYEHEEGCMDIRADNYSIVSDKECEDCCSYPALELEFSHHFENENIDTNFYFSYGVDTFRIRSLNFYLSDFKFQDGNQWDNISIEEYISILVTNSSDEYDEIVFPAAKINLGRINNYVLGTFKYADDYQGLNFDFGIRETINHADMDQIPSSNALYQNQDSMYIDKTEGFYFLKMDLEFVDGIEKNIRIQGDQQLISFSINHEFDFTQREKRIMNISLDYEKWFESIDFRDGSLEIIVSQLQSNLENSLSFN